MGPVDIDPIAAETLKEQRADTVSPSTTAVVDPVAADVITEQRRANAQQAQLLKWRAEHDTTDAGTRADVLRYSAASELEPSFVEKNLDAVKKQVDSDQVNWSVVAHRQPSLVKWLLENPENTPLVKDDAANLGGLEWAIKAPFHAFLDAIGEQRTVFEQFQEARGAGGPETQDQIRQLEQQYSNKDYGAGGFFQKGVVGFARMLPFVVGDIASRAVGAWVGGTLGGGAGTAGGGAAGAPAGGVGAAPGAVGGGVAGGVTGVAVGQFMGSGLFNYYEAVGPMYWRLSQLKDASGKPMDPEVARAFATGGALLQAGLFAGFLGKIGGELPGVKGLLAKFGANTVEKVLLEQTTAQAMTSGLKKFGTHWLMGATMMAGASAIGAATEESAKSYSGGFESHWDSIGSAAAQGFKSGLQDMWLLSALGPGREMLKDIGRARASAEGAVRLEAMTNSANASKLLDRLPEGFRKAVEAMKAENGAVTDVYVPVDAWTSYFSGKKVDPGKVAAEVIGDGGKAYAEAATTKGDLKIPVEKYLEKFAKTEAAGELAMDSKLRPDDVTPRQYAENQKALGKKLQAEAKARGEEYERGKKEVFDFINDQAVGAVGKKEAAANAKTVSEYAGTMALRLGVSVQEAAALGALGQLKILGPKGESIAQAAREKFAKYLHPEASRLLEERLKTLAPENRAREYYLDQYVSGLRNRRVFDATPVPEGKQVAVITSTDVKGINDNPVAGGHDVTNEMLRAIGFALGQDHPEAARGGTNFYLHVKDKAELDAILAKVRTFLGNEHIDLIGEVGGNRDTASTNLDKLTARLRAGTDLQPGERKLPERGGVQPGLDVTKLKFPEGKAAGAVPAELADKISKLSDKEYAELAYLDTVEIDGKHERTGLITYEGWKAIPRKAHAASLDAKGLKKANEVGESIGIGKEGGNRLLFAIADALAHFGGSGFDVAHLGGDEFAAQQNDPVKLEAFVSRVQKTLRGKDLVLENATTGKREVVPVDFRYGIGADYGKADRDLNVRKAREAQSAGVAAGPGDGQADHGPGRGPGDVPQAVEGAPRDAGRGRGAQRQGFEQVVGFVEGVPVTFKRGGGSGGGGDASFDFGEPTLNQEGRDTIARMQPAKRAMAEAWAEYAEGRSDQRPAISPDLEKQLAKFGWVDPAGYPYDERGIDMRKPTPGQPGLRGNRTKGPRQQVPDSLREAAQNKTGRWWMKLQAAGVGGDNPRGEIQLQVDPTGRPRAFRISVFTKDRTALAHETAHFLSWSLHDIATSDLATPDVKADYEKLYKWAGYASPEERLALTREKADLESKDVLSDADEKRVKEIAAKEERISHGWEQYLLEGKSPSKELRTVFSRFKDWLLKVYRGVPQIEAQYRAQYGEDLNLSDEVRAVFDRLLAADEALQQAQTDTGTPPTPPPLLTAAMTPDEREAYRRALTESRAAAEDELNRRAAEFETEKVDEARARAMVDVAESLDKQPVYRAVRYLQRGELVDANGKLVDQIPAAFLDENGNALKINRKGFVDAHGAELAQRMPARVFARTKKGGVPVEQLANLLGFESAEDMVAQMTAAEPREKAILRMSQDRIDDTFGPVAKRLADAALSAVHNVDRARATLLEIRAMAKHVDPENANRARSIDLGTLKASADRMASEATVRDLDPAQYARAERASALKAAELWGRGDKAEALDQQEARLFNQLLYRAARDAIEDVEKAEKRLEKVSDETRATLGKADPAYRDVHDGILAAIGFGDPPKDPRSFDDLMKVIDSNAQEIDFDPAAIKKLLTTPKDWGQHTVAEARNVADAIINLRHLAKKVNELDVAGQKQTKDAWFNDLGEALKRRKPLAPDPMDPGALGVLAKLKHLGRGADALLTDVAETYAELLDGGDRNGPAHRLFVDGRLECRNLAARLEAEIVKKVVQKFDDIPKEIRKLGDKRVDVGALLPVPPGGEGRFAPVYTRGTLWSLFLNWGNEGNRQRIRDGMKWTDDNVSKALSMLTEPELKYLQTILDVINSMKPELDRVHEKRTGLNLGTVDPTPIVVNGKEYAGGYFPLRADRRFETRAAQLQEGADIKSLFAPNYVRPTTPASFRKARQERAEYPVDLTWGVVPAHLTQVVHDIAYGDWVRQVGGVLFDPRFRAIIEPHLGVERAKEFTPWLRDVANARADSASVAQSDFTEKLGAFARNRAAVAVMGLNLPSILGQILDPWNAFQENVPGHHIAAAYVKVNSYMAKLIDLPELQLSKELAYRDQSFKENLRSNLAKMGPTGKGLGRAVSETAFALYEASDWYTSRVAWKAAFDHAQSEGMPQTEAAARADDVVRRSYASHDIAEKPPIMRSKRGLAALVMFYGFANRLYNSGRRSIDQVARTFGDPEATTMDRTRAVAQIGAKLMMLGMTGAAFAYLSGRGPKKDEDPKKWLAWKVALEPFNTVPFLGPALERMTHGQKVQMRTAPELALLEQTLEAIGDAAGKANDARRASDVVASVEALIGPAMAIAGLPAGQVQRTGGYGLELASGEARPRNAFDVASGLFYGKRKNQPRNPLSDIADAVGR